MKLIKLNGEIYVRHWFRWYLLLGTGLVRITKESPSKANNKLVN